MARTKITRNYATAGLPGLPTIQGPTSLHAPGTVLAAWDPSANFNIILILLESHIFEDDTLISNESFLTSSSSNKLQFVASSTSKEDTIKVANIICALEDSEFSIPEKLIEETKGTRKPSTRRAAKKPREDLVTVTLANTKVHTKLKGLAKKFTPELSSDSEEQQS